MPHDHGEHSGLTYRRREDVIVTDLEGEVILLDPVCVEMYSLAAVGRTVWNALPGTPEDLADVVTDAYDVDRPLALQDVHDLLHELQALSLVETHAV